MEKNSPLGVKYLNEKLQQDIFSVKGRRFKFMDPNLHGGTTNECDEKEINITFMKSSGIGFLKQKDDYIVYHTGTLDNKEYPKLYPDILCIVDAPVSASSLKIAFHIVMISHLIVADGVIINSDQLIPPSI